MSNLGKPSCEITVGIPTFQRPEKLVQTLKKILDCNPQPCEIIIHIDGQDSVTEKILRENFQDLKIIQSDVRVGPGGGRNRIIRAAQNPIIASFDDDSYPIDSDYFSRLSILFERFSQAAIIGAKVYEIDQSLNPDQQDILWTSSFIGCGCAYRREAFTQTQGYVPLPLAYGMEEVDLSLQLHHLNWRILQTSWLRVCHNTKLEHRNQPTITAASITNQALLTYLRYPFIFWWIGFGQFVSRIVWLALNGKFAGILEGITDVPRLIRKNRHYRQVISSKSLLSHLYLRRNSVIAEINPDRVD
ncbi:MAG: glycosyltransferase [Scytolyngbya sp. HA4215-MV1]|jgi:GT2 family glycosyltransferase|nr:glycosyltransferase [Scytolyngbya sp. HA4215-MV1]